MQPACLQETKTLVQTTLSDDWHHENLTRNLSHFFAQTHPIICYKLHSGSSQLFGCPGLGNWCPAGCQHLDSSSVGHLFQFSTPIAQKAWGTTERPVISLRISYSDIFRPCRPHQAPLLTGPALPTPLFQTRHSSLRHRRSPNNRRRNILRVGEAGNLTH